MKRAGTGIGDRGSICCGNDRRCICVCGARSERRCETGFFFFFFFFFLSGGLEGQGCEGEREGEGELCARDSNFCLLYSRGEGRGGEGRGGEVGSALVRDDIMNRQ